MGLSEKLSTYPKRGQQGPRCHTWLLLDSLPDDEREALAAALQPDSGWTASALSLLLREEGHHLSKSSIDRHRRGECACPRD